VADDDGRKRGESFLDKQAEKRLKIIQSENDVNPYRGTDDANADLLIGLHGDDILFCTDWEKWLIWDGTHWAIDTRLDIERLAADVPKYLRGKASDNTDKRAKILAKMAILQNEFPLPDEYGKLQIRQKSLQDKAEHLLKLSSALELTSRRNNMLTATRHKVVTVTTELNKWEFLLNAINGTINLSNGELQEHNREDRLTHQVGISFDASATCPTWLDFLDSIFNSDAELIQFVQRAIGYSLTGDVREQIMMICHGCGSNGKSVFLNIIRKLLGGLAWQAAPDLLMSDNQRRHPTEQADLYGRRVVICQETAEGRRLNEVLVKQLTGSDPITARRMHENFWQFLPTWKIWLSTNHKPEIRGTDHAIWRRVRLIPFNVTFHDVGQGTPVKDLRMEEKLTAELPGILAWAVRGALSWQAEGIPAPQAVSDATGAYRASQDTVAGWMDECCIVNRGAEAKASELYASYKMWCEQSGERPYSQKKLGMYLTEKGFVREKRRDHYWIGIGILADSDCDPCDLSGHFSVKMAKFKNFKNEDSSIGNNAISCRMGHIDQQDPKKIADDWCPE
jgi:putative DNA primase/helicase